MRTTSYIRFAVICALIAGAVQAGEWRWMAPAQRPRAETVDDIIRRRGQAAQPLGTNVVPLIANPKQAEALRLERSANRLGDSFGEFHEIDGILTYRREKKRIADPVRRYAGQIVVLGPETPEYWEEFPGGKVLNVIGGDILVSVADGAILVRNYPSARFLTVGSSFAGWVRATGEVYRYATMMGTERVAYVCDFGEPVTGQEATEAIAKLADEWEARAGALKRRAEEIKDTEKQARDERVRKFREEQEAKRRREAESSTVPQ